MSLIFSMLLGLGGFVSQPATHGGVVAQLGSPMIKREPCLVSIAECIGIIDVAEVSQGFLFVPNFSLVRPDKILVQIDVNPSFYAWAKSSIVRTTDKGSMLSCSWVEIHRAIHNRKAREYHYAMSGSDAAIVNVDRQTASTLYWFIHPAGLYTNICPQLTLSGILSDGYLSSGSISIALGNGESFVRVSCSFLSDLCGFSRSERSPSSKYQAEQERPELQPGQSQRGSSQSVSLLCRIDTSPLSAQISIFALLGAMAMGLVGIGTFDAIFRRHTKARIAGGLIACCGFIAYAGGLYLIDI